VKYLIAGLGNIGEEYAGTRHNIGFTILDALAGSSGIRFESRRLADSCSLRHKGRTFVLIKPTTYVNLSGRSVHYWLKKEKIPLENLLVVLDDIALPFGRLRLRAMGGSGGHNGLEHINQILGTQNYARLRFGIGDEFHPGQLPMSWGNGPRRRDRHSTKGSGPHRRSFLALGQWDWNKP
jgi:PTH1 family peptidyl-tRNA hydrolase